MSVLGINQYVLENHEKDIYDFLMSIIDEYKKQGKPEGYNIGAFLGMTFEICDEIQGDGYVEYIVAAKGPKGDYIGVSYINPEDIRFEDDTIYLKEAWEGLPGALEGIYLDFEMNMDIDKLCSTFNIVDRPGFYFMASDEWNEAGVTNDKDGKYFKRRCVIDTIEHSPDPDLLAKVVPEDFESLPLEEQEAICKQHDIAYTVTQIMSFAQYWDSHRVLGSCNDGPSKTKF